MFEVRCLSSTNFSNLCKPFTGQFLFENGASKIWKENKIFEKLSCEYFYIFFNLARWQKMNVAVIHITNWLTVSTYIDKIYDKNKSFYYFWSSKFDYLSSSSTLIFGLKFVKFEVRLCQSSGVRSSRFLSSFHHYFEPRAESSVNWFHKN